MHTHPNNHPIRLIALDLDGTLLSSDGSLSERNAQAIQTAVSRNIHVILATGKSRASALHLIEQLGLQTPGVYVQGVMVHNADGSVRYAAEIEGETAVQLITFAEEAGLPHIAYSRGRILTPYDTSYRRRLYQRYHEPEPQVVGPLLPYLAGAPVNKLLISDEANNDATRARLKALVGDRAHVTQAIPDYVEVLPAGVSKGGSVRRVLDDFGIDPVHALAIGDGENDLEMLQMAGVGVAMGNAKAIVRAAADWVTASNDENGVALAIERFALGKQLTVNSER